MSTPTTPKSERTREQIREAAVRSFRDNGYDATTIRELATQLDIAVGTAYYHFPSKSHLVQELYVDVATEFQERAGKILASERKLAPRVRKLFQLTLDQLEPYGAHSSEFLVAALTPESEASPLSPASTAARTIFLEVFTQAVDGAAESIPADISELAPAVLYRANLLASLAWVQDASEGHVHTRRLVDRATALIALALPALKFPPVKRAIRQVMSDMAQIG